MKPLIGLTADRKYLEEHYWHSAEEHCLMAVLDAVETHAEGVFDLGSVLGDEPGDFSCR